MCTCTQSVIVLLQGLHVLPERTISAETFFFVKPNFDGTLVFADYDFCFFKFIHNFCLCSLAQKKLHTPHKTRRSWFRVFLLKSAMDHHWDHYGFAKYSIPAIFLLILTHGHLKVAVLFSFFLGFWQSQYFQTLTHPPCHNTLHNTGVIRNPVCPDSVGQRPLWTAPPPHPNFQQKHCCFAD